MDLITGGLGFIGAHTVEHFLENTDHDLVVLDSLRFSGRVERLTEIEGYDPARVKVFWHDLRTPIPVTLRSQIGEPENIIHMASDSHVDRSITDPVPFVHNNIMATVNLLEYARMVKPQLVIQVSTDEVYGPAPHGYAHVETDPLYPSNPYSASKASQEQIAYSYWNTYGVPVVITRTMNNFGERQHPEKFLPLLIGKLLRGERVPVHGQQKDHRWTPGARVWLHARNHADALHHLIETAEPYDVFNVAGEVEVTNFDLAFAAAEILGVEFQYEWVDFHTSRPGHDLRYAIDGTKLAMTGWKAPLDFQTSFERTVLWYQEHPEWT